GQDSRVSRVLTELLDPAMEVAEDRVQVGDDLPAQLDHQAHHTMGRRMLRPHVQEHLALFEGVHLPLALGLRRPIRDTDELEARVLAAGYRCRRTESGRRSQTPLLRRVEVDRIGDAGFGIDRGHAGRLLSANSWPCGYASAGTSTWVSSGG